MPEIESFEFSLVWRGRNLFRVKDPGPGGETVTASVLNANEAAGTASDSLEAELAAWNQAFCELELPWRWDANTFRQLLSIAADRDLVGAYVERNQAHLLRSYEKAFLRDLVHTTRERCRAETSGAAAR
jgi:hypothetical protein